MKNFPQGMNKVSWFWFSWEPSTICRSISQATHGGELHSCEGFIPGKASMLPRPQNSRRAAGVLPTDTHISVCLSTEGETKGAKKTNGGHERDKVDKFSAGGKERGYGKEGKERGEGPGSEWTLNLCYRYFHASAVSHCFGSCGADMTLLRQ